MRITILLGLLYWCTWAWGQTQLKGVVLDEDKQAIFAANVFLKQDPGTGVTTDFYGQFVLPLQQVGDTLVVSFLGYERQEIPLVDSDGKRPLEVILKTNQHVLPNIVVQAKDPISEQFAVVKMDKMDVYLNPIAQGDPLKAITILPSSTTIDESANPSLRGSAPDRTRVVFNGVPIYAPVRSSQLNNQGFFSLFNPEMIRQQYVYASNPPLTYGNTSAGLVDIQTHQQLRQNQIQFSAGLANTGFLVSRKHRSQKAFLQAYGNFQFSAAFVGLNQKNLPRLKDFRTQDFGLNLHASIGEKSSFNSFHYAIDERYKYLTTLPSFEGNAIAGKRRYFVINNYRYQGERAVLTINNGLDFSNGDFELGNLDSKNKTRRAFLGMNYEYKVVDDWEIQIGSSYDYQRQVFRDSFPRFYYAFAPETPTEFARTALKNHNWETYFYSQWKIYPELIFSAGVRNNLSLQDQPAYLSWQLGLKYFWQNQHSVLLSGGKYHNYATANFFNQNIQLQSSYQLALDYAWENDHTLVRAALYHKKEQEQLAPTPFIDFEEIRTMGAEFYFERDFYNYFNWSFSNSVIQQKVKIDGDTYVGPRDFDYFIKTTFQYQHPRLFTLAVSYLGRPGTFYTPINGGLLNESINFYEPLFSTDLYSQQLGQYDRIDININRYFSLEKFALITFLSVNNIFNFKNEREVLYFRDYSGFDFDYYQQRTIYFGCVLQLNE